MSIQQFQELLAIGRFVTAVEMRPPKGVDIASMIDDARTLVSVGVNTINITDCSLSRLHASSSITAYILRREVGVDTIFHLTGRDRNVIGLQAELLGANALGLRNVLCLTGDPPKLGDHKDARPVYEVNSQGLLHIVNQLNAGFDVNGNELTQKADFFAGVAYGLDPIHKKLSSRMQKKLALKPGFITTQPVYSEEDLDRCRQLKQYTDVPIIVGLLPLYGARNANFIAKNVPGIRIPQEILDEINSIESKEAQLDFGIRIAREMLAKIREEFAGVYLIPPFHRYHLVERIIAERPAFA